MTNRPSGPSEWGPEPGWYADPQARGGHSYWTGHQWLSNPPGIDGHERVDSPQLHLLEPDGLQSSYAMSNPGLRRDVLARRHNLDHLPWRPNGFFSQVALDLAMRFGAPCGRGLVIDDFPDLLAQHPQRATAQTQSSAVILERSQADLVEPLCPGWVERRCVFTTWAPASAAMLVPLHAADLMLVPPIPALLEHWRSYPPPGELPSN